MLPKEYRKRQLQFLQQVWEVIGRDVEASVAREQHGFHINPHDPIPGGSGATYAEMTSVPTDTIVYTVLDAINFPCVEHYDSFVAEGFRLMPAKQKLELAREAFKSA